MIITSPTNPTVRHAQALLTQHRARKKSGQTVIEGVHLLVEKFIMQDLKEILSSNNNYFDLLRLSCLFGTLLSFSIFYIGLGLTITFLIIFFVATLIFLLFKEDDETAIKLFLFAVAVLILCFFFKILANVLLFLYVFCTICFLILQDWTYRIGHRIFHNDDFNHHIKDNLLNSNDIKKRILTSITFISYILMFILSIIFAYKNFDIQNYENLKIQKINILSEKDFIKQVINNEFTVKMRVQNWLNSKQQAITAFKGVFGKLGFIFTICTFVGAGFSFLESKANR
ncbi:hypothetical protein U0021_07065 [Moraxella canis]|uniref:Uncharacterized protein n=1 Tax=Moraxella canis TaxID=90239 RepID=A0ABZ0WWU4_9GAMM|nr:hypothetical protein [Moraxella canis]WQE03503.1 hypothetical protein U0021_07065 [Moraxella canis]